MTDYISDATVMESIESLTECSINKNALKRLITHLTETSEVLANVEIDPEDYTKGTYYANGYAYSSINATILELTKALAADNNF